MIDPNVYDMTEEQARLILSHYDLIGFFYCVGVCVLFATAIYFAVLGCKYFVKKYKNYKAKKEKMND